METHDAMNSQKTASKWAEQYQIIYTFQICKHFGILIPFSKQNSNIVKDHQLPITMIINKKNCIKIR